MVMSSMSVYQFNRYDSHVGFCDMRSFPSRICISGLVLLEPLVDLAILPLCLKASLG